jgi:hypothetical protein
MAVAQRENGAEAPQHETLADEGWQQKLSARKLLRAGPDPLNLCRGFVQQCG